MALGIKQATATIGVEARRIEDLAEHMKDRHEGAKLYGIAARLREAAKQLTETAAK